MMNYTELRDMVNPNLLQKNLCRSFYLHCCSITRQGELWRRCAATTYTIPILCKWIASDRVTYCMADTAISLGMALIANMPVKRLRQTNDKLRFTKRFWLIVMLHIVKTRWRNFTYFIVWSIFFWAALYFTKTSWFAKRWYTPILSLFGFKLKKIEENYCNWAW